MRLPQRQRPPPLKSFAELRDAALGMYAPVTVSKKKKRPPPAGTGTGEAKAKNKDAPDGYPLFDSKAI